MGIRTVELPSILFNQDSPPIVPVLDEEVLQYFVDNQHTDTMPSHCYLLGRHTLGLKQFLSNSTFVPHFLASYFLAETRSPKAMLLLIVLVLVQHDLLLECKPLVDWLKVSIVQDNGTYILGFNPDPVQIAMENALMEHRMVLHKNDLPG